MTISDKENTGNSSPDGAKIKIENLSLSFGGVRSLIDIDVDIRDREILAIIGPNGAGKTCILNCINGFYKPQQGDIFFDGKKITRIRPDKAARMGLARTFQNIELYTGLSTLDNIMAARHVLMKQNALSSALYYGWSHKEEIIHRKTVEDIIDFLEIESIRKKTVGMLPYGMRKRVELGRALALEPKVLLLDEPMAGMNLEETEDMARFILNVNQMWDVSIILVEHDMGVVMDISHRVCVLEFGQKIAEGSPREIQENAQVIRAYLGEDEKAYSRL